jgi:hypothetical protein
MRIWNLFFIALLAAACNNKNNGTEVEFHLRTGQGKTVYLSRFNSENMSWAVVDSQRVTESNALLRFSIAGSVQQLYKLHIPGTPFASSFINDSKQITFKSSVFTAEAATIEGSAATTALKQFAKEQQALAGESRRLYFSADSLRALGSAKPVAAKLLSQSDSLRLLFFDRYRQLADTTTSPGIFLWACIYGDPGNNPLAYSKALITTAAKFAGHPGIDAYRQKLTRFVNILEQEYQVGQVLPAAQLPGLNGMLQTVKTPGIYTYLDFWSPLSAPSLAYDAVKKQVQRQYGGTKLEVVSVALYDNVAESQQYAARNGCSWKQLIDVKMWDGVAAETFKMDSIPFNFLLAPDGTILAKAIPPDSVAPVLKKLIR